jgi:putative DNA methylase
MTVLSFIEQQFPVAKVSAEAYKERMAGAGSSQTLTGVGKWWGRKPLVLVRACLFGLLMPVSNDPKRDREIFLKIMTMDEAGLLQRRNKPLSAEKLAELLTPEEQKRWLLDADGEPKARWSSGLTDEERELVQRIAFERLTYDEKLDYCHRPEQIDGPSEEAWFEINQHLDTSAKNLVELTQALGVRRFGHIPRVGDPVCGGGSIPFEAARLGCKAYASDLSPVAALLTWGALNLVGGDAETRKKVHDIQQAAYDATLKEIDSWGLETNDKGWRHEQLYYVVEMRSPATGLWVPVAPSFVISERYKVCAVLSKNVEAGNYDIKVITGATAAQMAQAKKGTLRDSRMVCPETGDTYAIGDLRGDRRVDGESGYGLRMWDSGDLVPRPDDVLQERLYCVRWAEEVWVTNSRGELVRDIVRHFESVTPADAEREATALALMTERLRPWQKKGFIPSGAIPRGGDKTEEPIRTRGWTHWHHLFTPRQLLMLGSFAKNAVEPAPDDPLRVAAACLGVGAALERLSRLCGVDPHISKGPGSTANVFFNQALNPLMNFGSRQLAGIKRCLCGELSAAPVAGESFEVTLCDARAVSTVADVWFTDPPYADAVNYHELTNYFLAWYERLLPSAFPSWRVLDGSSLAVQGSGETFKRSMVDIYGRLARQMPDEGCQLVQFTHQNPAVWGDLGMILWASGLQVTAAWTIATETSSGGLKKGNYVQGTVNLVLRKRLAPRSAWLDEIYPLVEDEVKRQLDSMIALDDESDPNFGDTDYQLAAYAAALRVLTQFSEIEGMDIAHELSRERARGEKSEFERLIDRAVEIAADHLIPRGFEEFHWKGLAAPERLYLKGLELERHREARNGAYQELAKGFGVREYTSLYERSQPNAVRFKTASEFKRQQLDDDTAAGSFGSSLLRHVLFAIHETVREENARAGLDYLKTDGSIDYWGKRKAILAMLAYLKPLAHVAHMPHWQADADAAERLAGVIENDH